MGIRVQVSCLAIRDNKLAMIKKKSKSSGVYNLLIPPGGHVELHETLEEACVREMQEETGLVVSDLELKGVISFIAHTSDYHSVCFFFLAHKVENDLTNNELDKLSAHWVSLEGLEWNEEIPEYHRAFITFMLTGNNFLNGRVEWHSPDNKVSWSILNSRSQIP